SAVEVRQATTGDRLEDERPMRLGVGDGLGDPHAVADRRQAARQRGVNGITPSGFVSRVDLCVGNDARVRIQALRGGSSLGGISHEVNSVDGKAKEIRERSGAGGEHREVGDLAVVGESPEDRVERGIMDDGAEWSARDGAASASTICLEATSVSKRPGTDDIPSALNLEP